VERETERRLRAGGSCTAGGFSPMLSGRDKGTAKTKIHNQTGSQQGTQSELTRNFTGKTGRGKTIHEKKRSNLATRIQRGV